MIRAGTPKTVAPLGTSRNDDGVRAHDDVVANRDRAHDFAACAEITVIADRCAAHSADIHDTGTLVESATVANLFGQDENAAEVMDDKPGPILFSRAIWIPVIAMQKTLMNK